MINDGSSDCTGAQLDAIAQDWPGCRIFHFSENQGNGRLIWAFDVQSLWAALFLPLFVLYLILSVHHHGPPNWTAAAYVGGIVLLAGKWLELAKTRRWARGLALVALVLAALEIGLLLETRWLHLSRRLDPLDRARGSRHFALAVGQAEQSSSATSSLPTNYMTAALLSFYLPDQPETFVPHVTRPLNQLELWADYDERYPAGDALIVAKRHSLAHSLRQSFASLEPLGSVEAIDGRRKVGRYYLFLGRRYAR